MSHNKNLLEYKYNINEYHPQTGALTKEWMVFNYATSIPTLATVEKLIIAGYVDGESGDCIYN